MTVQQLVTWDGRTPRGVAGTAHNMAIWRRKGRPQTEIRCGGEAEASLGEVGQRPIFSSGRASRAMLFGDLKGFSKLGDAAIPAFSSVVMGQVGAVCEQCSEGLDFINTWGNGIFTVYADAGCAA